MTTNFFITHEDGTLNEYSGLLVAGTGAISASAVSAMGGTNFGMQSTVLNDSDTAFGVLNFTQFSGTEYTVSFWFDPNGISMPTINPTDWSDEDVTIFRLKAGATGRLFIELQYNGTSYVIRCCIRNDSLVFPGNCTSNILILNTAQLFQITVTKATTAASNDGELKFSINGTTKDTVSNIDLFNAFNDPTGVEVGLNDLVSEPNISGTCYFDEIQGGTTPIENSFRIPLKFIASVGAGAAGGAGGGDNPASISADGLNIYIASFNSFGFPILIKIASSLLSNGSIVFNPGEGGRIGIQCVRFTADHLWIAGEFDGTNTIEKSENAGSSFVVKDDGTMGTIRTFQIGPDSDIRILVFDGDNGDILETIDGGKIWITTNATVTALLNTIARFSKNLQEIIVGNEGEATNSINYSPNTGVNLEDFQTGVYPNEDATSVIVNG